MFGLVILVLGLLFFSRLFSRPYGYYRRPYYGGFGSPRMRMGRPYGPMMHHHGPHHHHGHGPMGHGRRG